MLVLRILFFVLDSYYSSCWFFAYCSSSWTLIILDAGSSHTVLRPAGVNIQKHTTGVPFQSHSQYGGRTIIPTIGCITLELSIKGISLQSLQSGQTTVKTRSSIAECVYKHLSATDKQTLIKSFGSDEVGDWPQFEKKLLEVFGKGIDPSIYKKAYNNITPYEDEDPVSFIDRVYLAVENYKYAARAVGLGADAISGINSKNDDDFKGHVFDQMHHSWKNQWQIASTTGLIQSRDRFISTDINDLTGWLENLSFSRIGTSKNVESKKRKVMFSEQLQQHDGEHDEIGVVDQYKQKIARLENGLCSVTQTVKEGLLSVTQTMKDLREEMKTSKHPVPSSGDCESSKNSTTPGVNQQHTGMMPPNQNQYSPHTPMHPNLMPLYQQHGHPNIMPAMGMLPQQVAGGFSNNPYFMSIGHGQQPMNSVGGLYYDSRIGGMVPNQQPHQQPAPVFPYSSGANPTNTQTSGFNPALLPFGLSQRQLGQSSTSVGMQNNNGSSSSLMFGGDSRNQQNNNRPKRSCWVCGSDDHFLPNCPLASRLEILLHATNRLYNECKKSKVTVDHDKFFDAMKVPLPTDAEKEDLANIYAPLSSRQKKHTAGPNKRAYCHLCHASGHYTAKCKQHCLYCRGNHGWVSCKDQKFSDVIQQRLVAMTDAKNNAFLMLDHSNIDELEDAF